MIKDAECFFVCGRRGSGKSTFVKSFLRDRKRVLAYDPQADYGEIGFTMFKTVEGIERHIMRVGGAAFRCSLRAEPSPETLDRLCTLAFRINSKYASHKQKLTLVCEELNTAYRSGQSMLSPVFTKAILQGRHSGIEIVGVTQRPKLVDPNFRGNARSWYVLPLDYDDDRKEIAAKCAATRDLLPTLQPHHWLHLRDGAMEKGQNPPLK